LNPQENAHDTALKPDASTALGQMVVTTGRFRTMATKDCNWRELLFVSGSFRPMLLKKSRNFKQKEVKVGRRFKTYSPH
jgi:hypothetical protein